VSYAEGLRAWCAAKGITLHERVLDNGYHHVWLCNFLYRIDEEGRDFEHVCRMVCCRLVVRGERGLRA
jgi:hypothetical protein